MTHMGDTKPKRQQRKTDGHQVAAEPAAVDTRRAILDAAAGLFLEHGYEGFSLRQVAREIGYSPTTIYLYFKDKDDLLFHVAVEGFRNFGTMLQAGYASASSPSERLRAIGRAYIQFGLENPLHYRLMFVDRGEFLRRQPPSGFEAPIDSFGILVQTVTECLEIGLFKPGDPRQHALVMWSVVHGLVSLATTNPYFDRDQLAVIEDMALDMIVKGLSP